MVTRIRRGNDMRANLFWRSEDLKRCRLCEKKLETLDHVANVDK